MRWKDKLFILLMIPFSLDILILTPLALRTGVFDEINPVHNWGYSVFGIKWSYIFYVPALFLVYSLLTYLEVILMKKYKPTKAEHIFALSVWVIFMGEIVVVTTNVLNLIWYFKGI